MRIARLTIGLAMAVVPAAAQAQTVQASNPQSVIDALRAAGLQGAELATGEDGSPQINYVHIAETDTRFEIHFYDCLNGRDCKAVQFCTAYTFSPDASVLAAWNRDFRFGRAYLDDGAVLQMDLVLAPGGMPSALFAENLSTWRRLVRAFEERIQRQSQPATPTPTPTPTPRPGSATR